MKAVRVKSQGTVISMYLEDVTGQKPGRVFNTTPNRVTMIPADYARFLLNDPTIVEWIRTKKLIVLDNIETLEKEAIEDGYIQEEIKPVNDKEILNVLKGNNITKLKELLGGPDQKVVMDIAGQHVDELSQAMVREIEDIVGISLIND